MPNFPSRRNIQSAIITDSYIFAIVSYAETPNKYARKLFSIAYGNPSPMNYVDLRAYSVLMGGYGFDYQTLLFGTC